MHSVPERWQQQFDTFLDENISGEHRDLGSFNFRHSVFIRFPDGSHVMFRYAFYLIDRNLNEIAVFTEHCGYHIFPIFDTEIELLDSISPDGDTD